MKKSDRIHTLLQQAPADLHGHDPRYAGFFTLFDQGFYYEAHDLLEDLWLRSSCGDYFFYKGLIQAAGAFVHLQKNRIAPALSLLALALKNLRPFRPTYRGLDVTASVEFLESSTRELRLDPATPFQILVQRFPEWAKHLGREV